MSGAKVRLKIKRQCFSRTILPFPLTDEGCLFERDEDGSHSRNILCLFVGFRIEVAQAGYSLPLRSRAVAIGLCQESLLRCSTGGWETRQKTWMSCNIQGEVGGGGHCAFQKHAGATRGARPQSPITWKAPMRRIYVLHANTNQILCWITTFGLRNNQRHKKKKNQNKTGLQKLNGRFSVRACIR